MTTVLGDQNNLVLARDRAILSWGSVLGGLVVAIATSWLLAMLGAAIGVSIADISDAEAIGEGLGLASVAWLLLTFVLAFFIGGLVSGRLTGSSNDDVGMLHGFTMWATAIVLTGTIAAGGMMGVAQSGLSALGGIAAGSSVDIEASSQEQVIHTPAFDRIKATAIRNVREAVSTALAETSPSVSASEVNAAVKELDGDVLTNTSLAILNGNPDRAKDILAAGTNLTEAQISAMVNGVTQEAKGEIAELRAYVAETTEAASTYATATLWAFFGAMALALVAAIFGGNVGTETFRRLSVSI